MIKVTAATPTTNEIRQPTGTRSTSEESESSKGLKGLLFFICFPFKFGLRAADNGGELQGVGWVINGSRGKGLRRLLKDGFGLPVVV